jgi:dihydrofolate reductase
MRNLIINTFLTLDGVMQAPGGPEEDTTGGFTQGGWSVNYWDDVMGQQMDQRLSRPSDLLLGRKTYEIFAAHWPFVPADSDDASAAQVLNSAKKYVASRTLDNVEWNNSTLLVGDVADQIAKLKQQSGPEIQVHGSGNLIQTLLKHDLIDEYHLWVFPVLVGRGKRLFAEGTIPGGMKLTNSITATTGVIIATYERAGALERGSFALEEPTPAEIERRRKVDSAK